MSLIDKAVQEALKKRKETLGDQKPASSPGADDTGGEGPASGGPSGSLEGASSAPEVQTTDEVSETLLEKQKGQKVEITDHRVLGSGYASIAVIEEYGKLKSRLFDMAPGVEAPSSILITSTNKAEGKSLTAVNLSISLAQSFDHTVLLIDADLRNPTIHNYFNIPNEVGLIQCLREEREFKDALVRTGIGNLVVLPTGGVVNNPVELLSSARSKAILEEVKNRYSERIVVMDSPPALYFADAHVLAPQVDGVLFVVREGYSKPEQIVQSLKTLEESNVLGFVFNGSSISGSASGYYNQYAYGNADE